MARSQRCSDACHCRNLICAIVFLVIGIVLIIAGGVLAAVGFGTRPKDMFDTKNLSMRVVGLCMAGTGILPVIMGTMFAVFYCSNKRGMTPGQKKGMKPDVEMAVVTKQNFSRNEYPYPPEGGPLMYKPGSIADDSMVKFDDMERDDHYSVVHNQSGRSFNNGGVNTSHVYSEVRDTDAGRVTTKTTTMTTVTKTFKGDRLPSNTPSGSSGVTFNDDSQAHIKAKRVKQHQQLVNPNESLTGSLSSDVPSFNGGDAQQKAKRPKKPKKQEPEDVFDETDEPLPYHSHGSGSSEGKKHISTSPSNEDDFDVTAHSRVSKKRNRKV